MVAQSGERAASSKSAHLGVSTLHDVPENAAPETDTGERVSHGVQTDGSERTADSGHADTSEQAEDSDDSDDSEGLEGPEQLSLF